MLVNDRGRLSGIFTDSDLARLFECQQQPELDVAIREVMTALPKTIQAGSPAADAVAIMSEKKISELPVVDAEGRPVGLIDITDVVNILPRESCAEESADEHEWRVFHEPEEGSAA